MNIFLILAIIIANVIAITIVYQILKKQPKKEILIFIAASITIIYLIISLIYWLSGFGIDASVHESSKNFVTFLFVPINVIIFVPYIAFQYKKIRQNKKIEKYDIEKISTKIAILLTAFIITCIGEFFYFKNIQFNIKDISEANQKIKVTTTNTDTITNVTESNDNTINTVENSVNTIEEKVNNLNEITNDVVNKSSNIVSNKLAN